MKKLVLLILILSILLYGCLSDPERLTPPTQFKTGLAHQITEPLDIEQLFIEDHVLETGWNVFVWDKVDVDVGRLLESFDGIYYYVYNYDDESFYFPSDGKYAKLKTDSYYSKNLFENLESGKKYGIYVLREGTLRYS